MVNYIAKKAIIMAAGKGDRLSPITEFIPKPLVKVNGQPLIESVIEALIRNGIKEIHIVVGHLKEQFDYLIDKYNFINLIENPYYETCNNISSLYVAREYLGSCIITDADMIVYNHEVLKAEFCTSGYCSAEVTKDTKEWVQKVDDNGFVLSCNRNGGNSGWQLFSISFWSEEDGKKLKDHLEEMFERKKIVDVYWDDIPMFEYKDEYNLKIRPVNSGDIIEIDSLNELLEVDGSYSELLDNGKNNALSKE